MNIILEPSTIKLIEIVCVYELFVLSAKGKKKQIKYV